MTTWKQHNTHSPHSTKPKKNKNIIEKWYEHHWTLWTKELQTKIWAKSASMFLLFYMLATYIFDYGTNKNQAEEKKRLSLAIDTRILLFVVRRSCADPFCTSCVKCWISFLFFFGFFPPIDQQPLHPCSANKHVIRCISTS